jgi:hypothetical protein
MERLWRGTNGQDIAIAIVSLLSSHSSFISSLTLIQERPNMKRFLLSVFVAVLAFSMVAFGQTKKETSKAVTIKGEVVDVACYLAQGARGSGHVACATACAKAGGALGILAPNGKLYVSVLPDDHKHDPNYLLMDHIGQTVDAKGFVRSEGGVNGLMILSVAMAN